MNEEQKKAYLEQYHHEKERGVPFFPDVIFKDSVIILVVFLILVALAYFKGAPLEARADPADSAYTPRPEWYFLFLFQLLKYFPGQLEVVGVVVIPTLAILGLFALPFIDRSPKRHFLRRPGMTGITLVAMVGIISLTYQSVREAAPPAATTGGDQTAALYLENCANCHGSIIKVSPGADLHNIIAQGRHEGMPAWSADLTADQIDALAGFIISPGGSQLFALNCGACHESSDLVATDPVQLKSALGEGLAYAPHKGLQIPDFTKILNSENQTQLLNFLGAPDGQRLFAIYCSDCHGTSVAYSGDKEALREQVSEGGMHRDMPTWKGKLSESDLQLLSRYIVNPTDAPEMQKLFKANCSGCHGNRIPEVATVEEAYQIISTGGSHQVMPVWGEILTNDQLDALVNYIYRAKEGSNLEVGQQLFEQNCTPCHGRFGEGGPNPSRPSTIIAPISSSEFLKTRDDTTLNAIISQGQPNLGMSPFGNAFGGALDEDQVGAIVAFIRAWEANPPVELPPEIAAQTLVLKGAEIYQQICAQCHGEKGEGLLGTALDTPEYQDNHTDQAIFNTISLGHTKTSMIAWGNILTVEQINQLVAFIRQLRVTQTEGAPVSFESEVLPIFETDCKMCHGSMGGWDGTSFDKAINSGDHGPVVIPGDVPNSLLAQKIQGLGAGGVMPPGGKLSDEKIRLILEWIQTGAQP